ncbi:TetR/AcrR family transcriptional regulator [Nocardia camponoti]|uniref:Transcriptional regulator, TetR family protein n=1 Tax=Nocardia camponoti TaxID=1616106 RepID=A0A917QA18_9NOCA|nr:TetR/AcrR family transcriptional regulator [Nocardia camponoti]GGK38128.1 putative transcriptional regulator, TetR family protein [Nocardia camponoti]
MTEPRLSKSAIVDTAIDIADANGLDALSMRRIADRLGVGTMSLYRHVANKDDLIAAMTDEIAGRYPYPDPTGLTWRDRVRIAAEVDWLLYQQHPWVLLTFAIPRYSFGPRGLTSLAWLVEGLRELNVSAREATTMAFSVWNYISGASLPVVSGALLADNSTSAADDRNGLRDILDGHPTFPVPAGLAELEGAGVSELTSEDLLFLGLTALCDGFAVRHGAST